VATAVLGGSNQLEDLALVLFVGMLSGTYSSIFIATPVLADLKERQPQYQALAKRVAVRASGGRAARRAAAKAEVAGRGRRAGAGGPAAAAGLSPAQLAEEEQDDVGFTDEVEGAEPGADELTTTASRAPGAPASRGAPGTARSGPRQQPRRGGSTSRHRPAGKKKRR
jgi:preprotein translocase subunit SecF